MANGKPIVLCILDGWGHRESREDNAVALARTPVFDHWSAKAPHCLLRTDGLAVGLPEGQFGNSEVGHMNLGAGRVVMQELPRIDEVLANNGIAKNRGFQKLVTRCHSGTGVLHLIGLMSPGGVHAHQRHLAALAAAAGDAGLSIKIHAFLDGRDTPPRSAIGYLEKFLGDISSIEHAQIATVSGRYYSMDRDNRWERTKLAYDAIVEGKARKAETAIEAIEASYAEDIGDEFVHPTIVGDYAGMNDGDALLCANFRADRVRQILRALLFRDFGGFERRPPIAFATAAGMLTYADDLNSVMTSLLPRQLLDRPMGEVVARAGRTQLRMAETEKYAHVTFFFNGGTEPPFDGEERILVPSPKVATYDLQPQMSAPQLGQRFVEAVDRGTFDFILINFANPDMVGHTGDLAAAITAVETVDTCLGEAIDAVRRAGGAILVTADHGNCELMRDPETGAPHTAHTTNKVPCFLVGGPETCRLVDGKLADIAPTLLDLMQLAKPSEMTGASLVHAS